MTKVRTKVREKLREWLLGEEPPFRYTPGLDEVARSPEGIALYRIDQKMPGDMRPVLAVSERHLLRCYRVLEGGGQCGLLLFRNSGGALFCYEHGQTRK